MLLDGGLATELEARGHDLSSELWSARLLVDDPAAITQVHADYVAAGADVITAATYQATFPGLIAAGLTHTETGQLMHRAIDIARTAAGQHVRVAGSIGPYGAYLADGSEYVGDYGLTAGELLDFHAERWRVIEAAGIDYFACETIPSFIETCSLRELAMRGQTPAWFSFTLRDEAHISDGTPLVECGRLLDDVQQVVAVGVNCCRPEHVLGAINQLKQATNKPIIVYPNSGEVWDAKKRDWVKDTAQSVDAFMTMAEMWMAAGATWIGGCCRTMPEHIRALKARRDTVAHVPTNVHPGRDSNPQPTD